MKFCENISATAVCLLPLLLIMAKLTLSVPVHPTIANLAHRERSKPCPFPQRMKQQVINKWIYKHDASEPVPISMYDKLRRTCVHDGADCPYISRNRSTLLKPNHMQQDRSVSPWVYTENYNPNRFPAIIPEACCACKYCVDYSTAEPSILGSYRYASEPTHSSVEVVLRNNTEFSVKAERIATGCICVVQPGYESFYAK